MMTRWWISSLLFGCASLALAACNEDAAGPDAGTVSTDAGRVVDGGTLPDLGVTSDAGATTDAGAMDATAGDADTSTAGAPRAVQVARATAIPACTVFVDAASSGAADGSAARPYATIAAAVSAAGNGAVICVAEGTYREALAPGEKYFTLAGGFQSGQGFAVRDSARYVSKGQGDGTNSFLRIEDPGPSEGQLTAIDGFELTGYSQAVYRDIYYSQRFDITNCYIHDNICAQPGLVGAAFALINVSGTISGNVLARNRCYRGGGGAVADSINSNTVTVARNRVDANEGDEPGISHGGGLYLFAHDLSVTANELTGNIASGWGGGLYVGAGFAQETTARLSWNVYRDNRAGGAGGGFFCDDSARCISDHELYEGNCGGNVFLDSGLEGSPTIASFDHLTNYRALEVGCAGPGAGVIINKENEANDAYTFTNSIFWGNATDSDFAAACDMGCANISVTVSYSSVQTRYANGGVTINFGEGNLAAVDPRFVDPAAHDFHLRSTFGHWTPAGYVSDGADSPALAAGDPAGAVTDNPPRAGGRSELGAYGNSPEASYVR